MVQRSTTSISLLVLAISFVWRCIATETSLRVVTREELAVHDGKQNDALWLSILGEVYDVTAGKEYYGENGPYSVFVGKDGSVPFVTGAFTEEEAAKPLSVLEPQQMYGIENWRSFYETEEKYKYIGVLEGVLYDRDGNPTDELLRLRGVLAEAKVEAERREAARKEKIRQRRLKKEAAEQAAQNTASKNGEL